MAFEFEIVKPICVISERDGWAKEMNLVSWNHREPKLDIREWNSDHSKMTKGITFTVDETNNLYMALHNFVTEDK